MVVSYRLSIVTIVLSVTIRPQFAIECLRCSNQQGVGHFRPKFGGVPNWSRPMMFGSAESKHPRLTNGEIISDVFQPMWSQSTNITDGRTDRQTTCDRNTALCTKVHRTVINREVNVLSSQVYYIIISRHKSTIWCLWKNNTFLCCIFNTNIIEYKYNTSRCW